MAMTQHGLSEKDLEDIDKVLELLYKIHAPVQTPLGLVPSPIPPTLDLLVREFNRLREFEKTAIDAVLEERERSAKAVQEVFVGRNGICPICKYGEPHVDDCRALEAIRRIRSRSDRGL